MYNFDLRHKNIYKNGSQIWVRNQNKSHTILASSSMAKKKRHQHKARCGHRIQYRPKYIKIEMLTTSVRSI